MKPQHLWGVVFGGIFASSILYAQESESNNSSAGSPVIVIDEDSISDSSSGGSQVFVESGSDVIMGEPLEHPRAAYRSWKAACDSWKNDLKSMNKRNLMIASCGAPTREEKKVRLDTTFQFQSQATYKIKVGCE